MDLFDPPQLRFVGAGDLDELAAAVTSTPGLGCLVVAALDDADRKDEVLVRFAQACGAPDYVRPNWDSFDEWVRDLSWLPAGPRVLLVTGWEAFGAADFDGCRVLFEVLTGAVREHAPSDSPLTVVVVATES